jgi:hypothetical protein
LAAGAGVILLWTSSVVAPSAGAHDGHTDWFKWREPEENSDVSGEKVNVRAKVQFAEGVKRWTLEILPPDGYATVQSWGTVCEGAPKEKKPKTVEITCEWNSATYPDGKPSRNQAYRARVKAWNEDKSAGAEKPPEGGGSEGGGGSGESTTSSSTTSTTGGSDESSSSTSSSSSSTTSSSTTTTTTTEAAAESDSHDSPVRTLVVANPPSPPEDVHLAYAKKTSVVTVSWTANPEPDIAHYLVEEKYNDGEWSLAAKTTDTTWTKQLDEKGTYRFRVAAARWVGSTQRVKEGPRREPQSGMRKVEADPKNTTETSRPEQAAGSRKKDEQQDGSGKKKDDQQPQPEESTSSTAPPDSVIVNYDGSADPSATSTTGAAQAAASGPSGVSSIQPGSPGSVQTRYADPPRLPAPVSPEQAYDPGFSLALPYPKEVRLDIGPPPPPPPRLLGTVVLFDTNEAQRRGLVGVLAGGLVIFMLSMQAAYLNRRPRAIDLAASADWD